MGILPNEFNRELESKGRPDDFYPSQHQENLWFQGSLMRNESDNPNDYRRLVSFHNRITHLETKFDERFQANYRVASELTEFFPNKWCWAITEHFRKIDARKLGIKSDEDRIGSFLGYIELYLSFRGLTMLKSTLEEINSSLCINLTKNSVRCWKMKLLSLIPELRGQWKKIRAPTHQTSIIAAVIKVMNQELMLSTCTKEEIFTIKQMALENARKFAINPKSRHVKNVEIWAQAVCVKALRDSNHIEGKDLDQFFPKLPSNVLKIISNKRWQLDTLLD